jgi:hypothetical protein
MKPYPYRELVGKPLYLAVATRPDIAYVVGVLCRFVENPGMDYCTRRIACKDSVCPLAGSLTVAPSLLQKNTEVVS